MIQDTPEILVISDVLERPSGQCTAFGVVCIGAAVAAVLVATNHSEAAVKVASVAFTCMCTAVTLLVWKCGTLLVRTIDRSLRKYNHASDRSCEPASPIAVASDECAVGVASRRKGANADQNLMAARKNVKVATWVCLVLGIPTIILLMFAVASGYGTAAPLLFFGVPLGFAPLLWFIFNVQLHAGRSKTHGPPGLVSSCASESFHQQHQQHQQQQQAPSRFHDRVVSMFNGAFLRAPRVVLPTETPASP